MGEFPLFHLIPPLLVLFFLFPLFFTVPFLETLEEKLQFANFGTFPFVK